MYSRAFTASSPINFVLFFIFSQIFGNVRFLLQIISVLKSTGLFYLEGKQINNRNEILTSGFLLAWENCWMASQTTSQGAHSHHWGGIWKWIETNERKTQRMNEWMNEWIQIINKYNKFVNLLINHLKIKLINLLIHFNTLLKSDVPRRDHVSVVMDPMNVGSRIVNFIRDGTVFA